MTEIIQFFTPFFSAVLFNHSSLALIEMSFFISILMYGTVGKLVDQNPGTSYAYIGYLVSVTLFLSSTYILFCELAWWKSIINIVVSTIVFVIISELTLSLFINLFSGFYNTQSSNNETTLKRGPALFIVSITICAVFLSMIIKNKIF